MEIVFHLQISHLSHQSQAVCSLFRALLQLRWWVSLLTAEFTINYTSAKKCFWMRIVGFPNGCCCGSLPVAWTCPDKASVVSFAILKCLIHWSWSNMLATNIHNSLDFGSWKLQPLQWNLFHLSKFITLSSSIDDCNIWNFLAILNFHRRSE